MKRIIYAAVLALSSSPLYAGNALIMPELGRSVVNIRAGHSASGLADHDVGFTVGVLGGYKFESNIILALSHSYTDTDLFWGAGDNYQVIEFGILGGYSFEVAPRLRVTPMVGWGYWKLSSTEGELFNSGPEERREFHGRDPFWRLNLEIPLSKLVQLNISYLHADYDFGRSESTRFGVKFEF